MYFCSSDQLASGGSTEQRAVSEDLAPLFRIWLALEREMSRGAAEAELSARTSRRLENLARIQWHLLDLAAQLSGKSTRAIRGDLAAWRAGAPDTSISLRESLEFDAAALASLCDLVGLSDESAWRGVDDLEN